MSTTKIERRTLDHIPIVGGGVDALDRRKEHNNNQPVSAEGLSASIAKVRDGLFEGLKMLRDGARNRLQK
jgi:hypothetical protein